MPLMWWDFQTFFWNHNESDSLRCLISLLLLLVSPSPLQTLHSSGNLWFALGDRGHSAPFICAATSVVITLPRSVTSVQGSCFSMSAWYARSLKWPSDWHHITSLFNWNSPGFIYFQFLQTAQYKLKSDLRLVTHIVHWDLWHSSWEWHIVGATDIAFLTYKEYDKWWQLTFFCNVDTWPVYWIGVPSTAKMRR